MDDILDYLYMYLAEKRLPRAESSRGYLVCCRQAEAAAAALERTFSEDQKRLYLQYEETQNAVAAMESLKLFRETFSLARELFL